MIQNPGFILFFGENQCLCESFPHSFSSFPLLQILTRASSQDNFCPKDSISQLWRNYDSAVLQVWNVSKRPHTELLIQATGEPDPRTRTHGSGAESFTWEQGSLLPRLEERWLASGSAGDRCAEASYKESQGHGHEVSKGWVPGRLSAPSCLPGLLLYVLMLMRVTRMKVTERANGQWPLRYLSFKSL